MRIQISLLAAVCSFHLVSCADSKVDGKCLDEIQLAPAGYSEIAVELLRVNDTPEYALQIGSKKCTEALLNPVIARETQSRIHKWLDQHGSHIDEYSTRGSATLEIYKIKGDNGYSFVTEFIEPSRALAE